jgi:UDPglucose 6-dehydrogenase
MKITIVGSGYVGLVSGACMADFGHDVVCVDKDTRKIDALRRGEMTFYEPGLKELVATNAGAGRLTFSNDLGDAMVDADVVFIAVGTPARRGDGYADLSYVYAVAREIGENLRHFKVIVTKSTVPVGTGDEVERVIREVNPDARFSVASNPEFLREGAAIEDFRRPDRIVVGIEDDAARQVLADVYRPLTVNQAPIMFTKRRTAELIKYTANAFLAMKISFINEVADLCEVTGANVQEVARGIGLDNRIGSKFLHAGPGYGGSCFPKDTMALVKIGQDFGSPMRLVETTVAINEQRKRAMSRRIVAAAGGDVRGKKIAVLGLTFKPETDDMREAPSIDIIRGLLDKGANVFGYDPEGMKAAGEVLEGIEYGTSAYDVAQDADAIVLITEWSEFRSLDLGRLKGIMKTPLFVDLRNVYRRHELARHGFTYRSVGRPDEDISPVEVADVLEDAAGLV